MALIRGPECYLLRMGKVLLRKKARPRARAAAEVARPAAHIGGGGQVLAEKTFLLSTDSVLSFI